VKEIVLVTASWCHSCHAMEKWFFSVEIPGIVFKTVNIEDPDINEENVSSVPTLLFKKDGILVQSIQGALNKFDFLNKVKSIYGASSP